MNGNDKGIKAMDNFKFTVISTVQNNFYFPVYTCTFTVYIFCINCIKWISLNESLNLDSLI